MIELKNVDRDVPGPYLRGAEPKIWRQNMGICRQKWEFADKKWEYTDKFSISMARIAEKSFCGIKFADGRQSRGGLRSPQPPSRRVPAKVCKLL